MVKKQQKYLCGDCWKARKLCTMSCLSLYVYKPTTPSSSFKVNAVHEYRSTYLGVKHHSFLSTSLPTKKYPQFESKFLRITFFLSDFFFKSAWIMLEKRIFFPIYDKCYCNFEVWANRRIHPEKKFTRSQRQENPKSMP